jgi:hypothetical protein
MAFFLFHKNGDNKAGTLGLKQNCAQSILSFKREKGIHINRSKNK